VVAGAHWPDLNTAYLAPFIRSPLLLKDALPIIAAIDQIENRSQEIPFVRNRAKVKKTGFSQLVECQDLTSFCFALSVLEPMKPIDK